MSGGRELLNAHLEIMQRQSKLMDAVLVAVKEWTKENGKLDDIMEGIMGERAWDMRFKAAFANW